MSGYKRLDGRMPEELRPVKITRGILKNAEGSCLFELGDTKVICSATITHTVPSFLKDTGSGWVTAEYGMLPRSTKERIIRESVTGKIGGRTQEIQRLIGRTLRSITDLEGLGERTILIDCDVLQADGGTRTAAITGAFLALYEASLYLVNQKWVRKKPIRDFVAAVSVGIIGDTPLLDLNYEEDSHALVDMNIAMTGSGQIVEIQGTAEGKPFSQVELEIMLRLAKEGIERLIKLQKETLGIL